jgi:hypothetical protein
VSLRGTTGQEIPYLLWNLNFHYSVHKKPPLDSVINQLNSPHINTHYYTLSMLPCSLPFKVSNYHFADNYASHLILILIQFITL